jgi:hypothetical protein
MIESEREFETKRACHPPANRFKDKVTAEQKQFKKEQKQKEKERKKQQPT